MMISFQIAKLKSSNTYDIVSQQWQFGVQLPNLIPDNNIIFGYTVTTIRVMLAISSTVKYWPNNNNIISITAGSQKRAHYGLYRIAENFQGRKHSRISQFQRHPQKFSPQNLDVPYPPMLQFSIPRKFSPRNGHSYRSVKVFSLESFPLYSMSIPQVCLDFLLRSQAYYPVRMCRGKVIGPSVYLLLSLSPRTLPDLNIQVSEQLVSVTNQWKSVKTGQNVFRIVWYGP